MVTTWQAGQQRAMHYSAKVFRSLLAAVSRPGDILTVPPPDVLSGIPRGDDLAGELGGSEHGAPCNRHALGLLATLLDRETTFVLGVAGGWLEREMSLSSWLKRFSGARMGPPSRADFALCLDGGSGARLADLPQGTDAEPEGSATALLCVSHISAEPESGATVLELRGPGIRETAALAIGGLPRATLEAIVSTRRAFPLGVDVFLIDDQGRCAGLPRTTRVSLLSMPVEEA
jgi:alpha-D-ribose 1-methylphosphonate 5-triphosphate synthase subunit PhnH